jgi:hypothetical protein
MESKFQFNLYLKIWLCESSSGGHIIIESVTDGVNVRLEDNNSRKDYSKENNKKTVKNVERDKE